MPLNRITDNIRQLGWTNGLLFLAHRALSGLSGGRIRIVRYYLVAQPVPHRSLDNLRPSKGNAVTVINRDDPLTASFPRPPSVIAKRFANNNLCLAARSGERFSGFLWIARDCYAEDEVRCLYHLENPQISAWDYDVYVDPDFRIGRTFARLWDTANKHLSNDGVKWSVSRISAFNPGSLQAHRRLDIKTLCTANFLCIGPFQLMIAGISPYVHASFSTRSCPTLFLNPLKSLHRE